MRRLLAVVVILASCGYGAAAVETVPPPTSSVAPTTTSSTTTTTTTTVTTTTSTSTTTTTLPPNGELIIHGTGDVSLDPSYVWTFNDKGYHWAWSGLQGIFWDSIAVVNLECPVTNGGIPLDKEFVFKCDPEALDEMAFAGVDVANQANNHLLDWGRDALLESITHLKEAGIGSVGSGATAAEAYAPHVIERSGWTVAVLGFGGVVPSGTWLATDDRPGMANGDDTSVMVEAVAAAAQLADFVVVTVHWGMELDTSPRADDIERAKAMIDAGADVIFGHHQHRLGPMSWYAGKPIFWGLGNFVWPRLSLASADTAVAEVRISPDGEIVDACMIPATITHSGHPVLDGPYQGCNGVESPTLDLG